MAGEAIHHPKGWRAGQGGVWLRTLLGLGVMALLALAGYLAFVAYARAGPTLAGGGYLAVALVAGAGAFFSPCSFPLLPSYFAYAQATSDRGLPSRGRWGALTQGTFAAAGVLAFNAILGLMFGLAGVGVARSLVLLSPAPSQITVALRLLVGAALVGLGVVQGSHLSLHGGRLGRVVRLLQAKSSGEGPFVRPFLYGFAYTLVGIGCTAPFLATVVVLSLAAGGLVPALASFLAFSSTMAVLMVLVSVIATSSRRHLLKGVSENTPRIKMAGGLVLVAFGALLVVLTALPGLLRPLFP